MAKLYKVELYLIDANEQYGSLDDILVNTLDNTDIMYEVNSRKESKSFEWKDDLPINYMNCISDDYEKYFK